MQEKYQLVLQFPSNSIADYDQMILLENILIQKLCSVAKIDGHDCGSGMMNIFILTDEPEETFAKAKTLISSRKPFDKLVAAFRRTDGEEYSVIWPDGFNTPFKIT